MNQDILSVVEKETDFLMKKHKVSYSMGFLAEKPLLSIPRGSGDEEKWRYFLKVDELGYALKKLIKERRVSEAVNALPDLPQSVFYDISWEAAHRFMLVVAMATQAYFREIFPCKNVEELMSDTRVKFLPPQLAMPLWRLHKITGISPSMSYGLYSLWNWHKKETEKPLSLENIEMIHSFTGTLDERWFVWIHQIVEMVFHPAISASLKADILAKLYCARQINDEQVVINYMTKFLREAAVASVETVNVLERMREHCNPSTYFDEIRMFYSFPRKVVFEGVEDPEAYRKPLEIYGETGGQTPYQHFRIAALGIKHQKSEYFMRMRKHMSTPFRELVERMDNASIRDFVLGHKSNKALRRQYNIFVQSVLDWRAEHMALVEEYIKTHGESHGTGKPPLDWLKELYDETKSYLIDF